MLKGKPKIELPDDLDCEIAELINLINNVEGIETIESCFGHNEEPITIYCVADSIEDLHKFMYKYFYCDKLWHFELLFNDSMIDEKEWDKVVFLLKSDDKYIDFPTPQLMTDNLTKRFKLRQEPELRVQFSFAKGFKNGYEEAQKEFERPQSEWIDDGQYAENYGEHAYRCKECGYHIITHPNMLFQNRYCKNCGADMKGKEE